MTGPQLRAAAIAERVATCRDTREERGLSQRVLAKRSALHWNSLARIERGELQPTERTLRAIETALGIA